MIAMRNTFLSVLCLGICALPGCGDEDPVGTGTGGGPAAGGAPTTGGASTGGTASGGANTGGTLGAGGSTGGVGTGGVATGGAGTGGSTGGSATGGNGTGGEATGGGDSGGTGGTTSEVFALSSPSWDAVDNDDCDKDNTATCPLYPEDNTSFGANISPEMSWTSGPEGTMSYAIVLKDLSNNDFTHWAIWDIPANVTMLPEHLPMGAPLGSGEPAMQAGIQMGYFGSGACGNVYEHKLYALNVETLTVTGMVNQENVKAALEAGGDMVLATSFVRLQSREYCP